MLKLVSPAPESCYPTIWALLQEFAHQTLDSAAPKTLEGFIEKARMDLEAGGKTYAVYKDGELAGGIWFESVGDEMCLGHLVFDREHLSSAEKLSAARAAVNEVLENGCRKVIWSFLADNRAFRVFLKRLGAEHEGVFKQHFRREGKLVDAEFMASFRPGTD